MQLATLERLGDASRILDEHLATVFDRLTPAEQRQDVEIFDRLVTPSETKVAQSAGDLAAYLDANEDLLFRCFRSRRLLREAEAGREFQRSAVG